MGIRAAIYIRISRTKRELLDAKRQEPPCRAFCAEQGWQVVEVYVDDNRSAWKREIRRDAFERMLTDVRAGKLDAIVTWQADRLLRRVDDASAIINIAKQHGTLVANVGGAIDLITAAGRKNFYELAVASEHYSDTLSEKVRLKHAELAADGQWEGGVRSFGFDLEPHQTRDQNTGRLVIKYKLVPNPTEAPALQQAAQEVIAGRSHTAIAIQWNKQGLTTTTGKKFTPGKVKELLLSPKTAGLRYVDGKPVQATWPGIITQEQHEELRAILGLPRRERTSKGITTARTYLLGGFIFCGRCGHRLTAKRAGNRRRYACMTRLGGCGGLLRVAEPLEAHVVLQLLQQLPERLLERARRAPEEWETLGRLLTQRQTEEDRLEGLEDLLADKLLDKPGYVRQRKRIKTRITELDDKINQIRASAPRRRLKGATLGELEVEWEQLDLDEQRAVLADHVDRIVVMPVGRGKHFDPDPNIIKIQWRE
jgi:site-specific DNA recombinase